MKCYGVGVGKCEKVGFGVGNLGKVGFGVGHFTLTPQP